MLGLIATHGPGFIAKLHPGVITTPPVLYTVYLYNSMKDFAPEALKGFIDIYRQRISIGFHISKVL